MQKRTPAFTKNGGRQNGSVSTQNGSEAGSILPASAVEHQFQDWLYDGQFQRHSERTIEYRRDVGKKLAWFLTREGCKACGTLELRRFLAHVADGHNEPGGRWGNPHMKRAVRPATIHRYFRVLRTFFSWLVREGVVPCSPNGSY